MTATFQKLRALVTAAERGDRSAFMRARKSTMKMSEPARTLCVTLADLLDPRVVVTTACATAWRSGANAVVPLGIDGLDHLNEKPSWSSGFVWLTPETGAHRVLSPGVGLLPVVHHAQAQRPVSERTGTALAALALANTTGLSVAALVRAAHGVVFVPRRHQDMIDVLVHRMRAYLGDLAVIDRIVPGRLVMRPQTAFALPDPRCRHAIEQVVLRCLRRHGALTVAQLSSELDVPCRTMQRVLAGMVQDQTCQRRMRGRCAQYQPSYANANSHTSTAML